MIDWVKENKFLTGALLFSFVMIVFIWNPFSTKEESVVVSNSVKPEEELIQETPPKEESVENTSLFIDVKGAVKNPGVYEAVEGERVIDIIERAGGLAKDAEVSSVNLALKLTDEMIVQVLKKGEEPTSLTAITDTDSQQGKENTKIVNINTATAEEIDTLPGIGPSKASSIIEYRETNNGFTAKEDLKNVTGIGDKTYEKLESLIDVK